LSSLLEVTDLRVTLHTARGRADALREVSWSMQRGDTVGLIGESGCGKSLTALALMGLLPDAAQVAGSIRFDGQELTTLGEDAMCGLRGARIGMIFQEPMTALNPLHTIGRQIAESLRLHQGLDAAAARAAGCPVFIVPYGYNEGEDVQGIDCDAIVASLEAAARRVAGADFRKIA